VLINLVCQFHL